MRFVQVLFLGLLSTALSLVVVYALNQSGMNIMGWHMSYVLPIGAALVGLVASSGFIVGSLWVGRTFDWWLFGAVVVALVGAYFTTEYVEWRAFCPDGGVDEQQQAMTFWSYFDATTRAIHFGRGSALGALGYGIRIIEIGGFVGGCLYGMERLLSRPRCTTCNRYKRTTPLGLLPKDARTSLDTIVRATRDGCELNLAIQEYAPPSTQRATAKLDERMSLLLMHCPSCGEGELCVDLVAGFPEQRTGLRVEAHPLSRQTVDDFIRGFREA